MATELPPLDLSRTPEPTNQTQQQSDATLTSRAKDIQLTAQKRIGELTSYVGSSFRSFSSNSRASLKKRISPPKLTTAREQGETTTVFRGGKSITIPKQVRTKQQQNPQPKVTSELTKISTEADKAGNPAPPDTVTKTGTIFEHTHPPLPSTGLPNLQQKKAESKSIGTQCNFEAEETENSAKITG